MSEYVAHMRAQLGHQRLLLPAVSVLVWDGRGRLLMVCQANSRKWSTVGGGVEPGESPAQAAKREVREETGLEIELGPVRAAVGGSGYDVVYPNGNCCSYISVIYDARPVGGQLAADEDEVTAVRWVAPGEIRTLDLNSYAETLFRELSLI
jgi:8-oxo-dGTP pyrophosphatase MutT (NUDIX family)